MLLNNQTGGKKKGKKGKGGGGGGLTNGGAGPASKPGGASRKVSEDQSVTTQDSALAALESLLLCLGPWLDQDTQTAASSLILQLSLNPSNFCSPSLLGCLSSLCQSRGSQPSPLALSLPSLQQASLVPSTGIQAYRAIAGLALSPLPLPS